MDWRTAILASMIMLLPLGGLCIVLGFRLGWQAGLRLFGLLGGILTILTLVVYFILQNLPSQFMAVASYGLALFLLGVLGWHVFRFVRISRQAGQLVPEVSSTQFQTFTVLGIVAFALWGMLIFTIQTPQRFTNGISLNLLMLATSMIVAGVNSLQIREFGLVSRGTFVYWKDVESFEWKNVNYHDRLQVKLKQASLTLDIPVPVDNRYIVGDYLKRKFPQLYARRA